MIVAPADLEALYRRVAGRHGADADEAALFASALLRADLRDHTTQGIGLLPYLDEQLAAGAMAFGRPLETVRESAATAALDANGGIGQVTGARAMALAVSKAHEAGVGLVTVRRSGDFSMASAYVLQALDAGLAGLAMSTGPILVAPWGGRDARFCTNPLAFGVPAGEQDPIVIDMATSAHSMGAVVLAARDGERLEGAAVVDADGRYSGDPATVVLDVMARESRLSGALLPAGPKGFGVLLLVELLAGLLSGERTWDDDERHAHYGQTFLAIDPAHLGDPRELAAAADRMIETLTGARPAHGFDAVRLPGGNAAVQERHRRAHGVPVRDEEWEMAARLA